MSDYQSPFNQANGKMPYMRVNDYLFRATLQKSNKALKGLICALLHRKPEAIRQQYETREDFYRQQKYVERKMAILTKKNNS